MAATVVSICSNALLMLGAAPIADLNEDNDRARLAANLFDPARDMVLRRHPWNCAVKRIALAPDVTAPAFDWTYQFTLPSDWLRTLSVGEAGDYQAFAIEGRKILCDANPLLLRYVWRNDNPATWDDLLVWGMTCVMKAIFAYPTTKSANLSALVEDSLKDVLKQARAVDGQEQPTDDSPLSGLLSARFGGGNLWSV